MMAARLATLALLITALTLVGHAQQPSTPPLLTRLDHLVYATPDLSLGIDTIEKLLGVRATPGGQHPGLGTRNALVALGPSSYLEIIGPDPEQPKPAGRRRFGIDELKAPRIVGWVAKGTELGETRRSSRGTRREAGRGDSGQPTAARRHRAVLAVHRSQHGARRRPGAVLHRLGNVAASVRHCGSRRHARCRCALNIPTLSARRRCSTSSDSTCA